MLKLISSNKPGNTSFVNPVGSFLKVPLFLVFKLGNMEKKGDGPMGNNGGGRFCLLLLICGGFATLRFPYLNRGISGRGEQS